MSVKKVKCLVPFQVMQFCTWGFVRSCCPSWTRIGPIGNVNIDQDIMKIWNSPEIQKIRAAILEDRLDSVCYMNLCPFAIANREIDLDAIIPEDENMRKNIEQIKAGRIVMETGPLHINLSDSGDCNLKCKMCRANDAFYKTDPENNRKMFSEILPVILPGASYITLTGNGDPFFRKETRALLQSRATSEKYPNLKHLIITNAQMLNESMWEKIKHNKISALTVSVDAATETTYNIVRKGGSWEKLLNNLKRISVLRQQNQIGKFLLNFLVLHTNHQEIRDFARLALELNCDKVIFQKVNGLLDVKENFYFTKDIETLSKVGELLNDPVFSDPRINTTEIKFCKKFAGQKASTIQKIRTKLTILILTTPMRLYYRIRYSFAPVYYFFYKKARYMRDRFFKKK